MLLELIASFLASDTLAIDFHYVYINSEQLYGQRRYGAQYTIYHSKNALYEDATTIIKSIHPLFCKKVDNCTSRQILKVSLVQNVQSEITQTSFTHILISL